MFRKLLPFLFLFQICDVNASATVPIQESQSAETSAPVSAVAPDPAESTLDFALRCSEPLSADTWDKIKARLPQIGLDPTTIDPEKFTYSAHPQSSMAFSRQTKLKDLISCQCWMEKMLI